MSSLLLSYCSYSTSFIIIIILNVRYISLSNTFYAVSCSAMTRLTGAPLYRPQDNSMLLTLMSHMHKFNFYLFGGSKPFSLYIQSSVYLSAQYEYSYKCITV